MLKLVGAFLIVGGCAAFGMLERFRLGLRLRQLKQAGELMKSLESEITYGKAALADACRETAGRMEEPYAEFLMHVFETCCQNEGRAFGDIWKQELAESRKKLLLNPEETGLLEQFGVCSGYMDLGLQEAGVQRIGQELKKRMEETERENADRMKVSLCLSAAGGIVLAMLLI